MHSFRSSSFGARLLILLLCARDFERCESIDLEGEAHNTNSDTSSQSLSQNSNEEGGSNSGSGSESGSEDEPEDLYFYLFDNESVVTEYEGLTVDDAKDEPDFLYHPQPGHVRIVEFYAHWCPHCANFRPKYNAFAKKMMEIAERSKVHLDVYAVSCVPHRELCRDQDIYGYPRIKLFLGDNGAEDEGIEIAHKELHPFFILQTISEKTNTVISDTFSSLENEGFEESEHDRKKEVLVYGSDGDLTPIHVTKYDIYSDAYLSFQFAMKHSIFVGRDPPNANAKDAFQQWINLLNNAVPPFWPLQAMLKDLAKNNDTVLDSEENLFNIVDRYPPPRKTWSQSCSNGGYTCGLWRLFHIATVGVVEWNSQNVAGDKDLSYAPREVGQILRNYIEHFFACEVCRINFLSDYDNCAFHRCERLTSEIGNWADWKELPMWLFEVHNGVSSRLLKERAEREKFEPTHQQSLAVEWPAREECPLCWHADGRFEPDAVYSYLQLNYWPDELFSTTEHRNLLVATGNYNEEVVSSRANSLVGLIVASFLLILIVVQAQKQRRIHQTGKHKKADDHNFIAVKSA